MKFSVSIRPDPSDAELLFVRQLGAECVYTWVDDEHCSVEYLSHLRKRIEQGGPCPL